MDDSRIMVKYILKEILNTKVSSASYSDNFGCRNIFSSFINRNKKLMPPGVAGAFESVVLTKVKTNNLKQNEITEYLKLYLDKSEIDYVNSQNEFKKVLSFVVSKYTNDKEFDNYYKNIIFTHKKKSSKGKEIVFYIDFIKTQFDKLTYFSNDDIDLAFALTDRILESIFKTIILIENLEMPLSWEELYKKDYFTNNILCSIKNVESIIKVNYSTQNTQNDDLINSWFFSLKLIMKWFLKDYIKNDINVALLCRKPKTEKEIIDNLKIMDIYDLLKAGWTLDNIISECIKLHYDTIEDLKDEHMSESNKWRLLYKERPDERKFLINELNQMVGYCSFMPLFDDYYNKIKSGIMFDSEITTAMMPTLIPGTYNIYYMSICIRTGYKRTMAIKKLFNALLEIFDELATYDIFINEICTLAYSNSGKSICETLKMKFYKKHIDHGEIYYTNMKDVLNSKVCKDYTELKKKYENYLLLNPENNK
jgi:hypothetical protein